MSSKLTASIEVLRPFNVLIMMLVVGAAAILAGGAPDQWRQIVVAALVGGLVGGAANAINDVFDIAIDRVNRPDRPLPRGALSPEAVVRLWLVLSLVGISLNLFLHSTAFWITVVSIVILFLYSARWKRRVLLGNLAVAFMTGMAFVYGATVVGHPERAVLPAAFAFLINLGREVVKDIEDMEGDTRDRAMTFPLRFGVTNALILASGVLTVLLLTTILAYTLGFYGDAYALTIIVVDLLLVYVLVSLWRNRSRQNLGRLSLILKITMVIGLLAIYVGS